MAQDNLIRFAEAIINDAELKRKNTLENIKSENDRILNEKKKLIRENYEKKIRKQCDKLSELLGEEISKKRSEVKLGLINLRTKMFEDTFDVALRKLDGYIKTNEYRDYLESQFLRAVNEISADDAVCIASERDIRILVELPGVKGVSFEKAEEELLGGFILKSPAKRILIDCTFKEKIEREKQRFFRTSGLILE